MNKMNIAVLFGSRSCEHDVSIISALQLIEAAVQEMNSQDIKIEEPVLEDTAEAEEEEATVPVCSGDPKSE